jgi:valyl-tRNA synthetase
MKELPKAYEPKNYEDKIYAQWEDSGFFNPDISVARHITKPEAPYFSIVLPPPNVTGTLHMGHAVMLAVQDAMVRYHRMKGDRTVWVPGTDHAAIATQSKVEKLILEKEGKSKYDLGREEFLKRVEKFAQESRDTIVNQSKKMGASLDWSREAYTLDQERNLAVRTVFKKMYDDGLIYRGHRIVNWDPKGQTVISDDEIVYEERKNKFFTFKYGPFEIGTARPETKFGDKYVVMHPDDKRYKKWEHMQKITVEWINGPIEATIIKDSMIDMEFGTGVMTITPWHSHEDFALAEKYKLDKEQIIDKDGRLLPVAQEFSGMKISEAKDKIVEKLKAKGLLVSVDENYINRVATAERTGGVIEPQVMEQWFIDVNKPVAERGGKTLKELMQEVVKNKQVEIVPERFEKTYFHWIDNLRDWCISRQIWFGHQIPVWYRGEEIFVGVQAPEGDGWAQDTDTLDTWFSSGLWTFSTLGWPVTTVGFVRHGEAENNVSLTVSNDIDRYPLTETGKKQIMELAEQLRGQQYERIIASPILRTKQTAEIISAVLGIPVEFDDRIKEVGFGEYNHRAEVEVEQQRARNGWMVQTPFNMEPYVLLRERTHACMNDVIARYAGRKILMVSHGDTLAVLKQFGTDTYTNELGVLQKRGTCDVRQFDAGGRQVNDLAVFHPTSVMETGYDILFFWVARMILMTTYTLGVVPFKTVYLHGLVRDEQGRKMSKSLGNIIDPLDMIAKYGTDATRLSLLLGNTPGNDMKLSEEKIAGFRNFTNKLWNISRFMLINISEPKMDIQEPKAKTLADEWILEKLNIIINKTSENIEKFNFALAGDELRDFTWGDLADWYLEIAKVEGGKSEILNYILNTILKLWHPYMPFVTETIWQEVYGAEHMLMVEQWPTGVGHKKTDSTDFELVRSIITGIRSLRAENKIEPAKKLRATTSVDSKFELVQENKNVIANIARLEDYDVVTAISQPENSIGFTISGTNTFVYMDVDVAKEKPRLEKEIAELTKYISGLENKLSNQEFVNNAPPAVVEKEQVKLSEAKVKVEKLEEQLKALN